MEKIPNITPFRKFIMTIGNIPTTYLETMSYSEMLMWFCNFLKNEVIPAVNNNADAIVELQHYFDNLNVQEEINNKLDDMAEAGTLQEIIGAYLEVQGVLGFDTVDDLEDADNLINGSFARTYGKLTYNDGEGAFYKIRLKTESDVIDGDLLVGLTNFELLVAEKMSDKAINDLQDDVSTINGDIDDIEDDISDIQTALAQTNKELNLYKDKNLVVFGDSWSQPNIPNSEDEYWVKQVESALDMHRFNYAIAGAGFSRTGNKMIAQLETAITDMTAEQKSDTAIVIIFAGDNDLLNGMNEDTILTDAVTLITSCHTTFPNAKIIVAPFEWSFGGLTPAYNVSICNLIGRIDRETCNLPVVVLKLVRYWLYGIKSYYRNHSHPSVSGYKVIAGMFINAILGGGEHIEDGAVITPLHGDTYSCSYIMEDGNVTISYGSSFSSTLTNYTNSIFYLPAIATPGQAIIAPLYKAGDGSQVGSVLIDDDGTCYLKNVTLNAGTYCYMLPVTFKCSSNVQWTE